MKKIFLLLCLILFTQAFSQKTGSVTFDFTSPLALTPSVTPSSQSGGDVDVNTYKFKEGPVSIAFGTLTTPNPGARLATYKHPYTGVITYYLSLNLFTTMTFSVPEGTKINTISISDESILGGLGLSSGQPGKEGDDSFKDFWLADGSNVSAVQFNVSGSSPSQLHKITVSYTEPSAVLKPISSDIATGQTVASFKEINLTFNAAMSIINGSGITFANIDGTNANNMQATVSGNTVKLAVANQVTTDGTYKIQIPAGCFRSSNGYENAALEYIINVVTPKNILEYESVTPEQGEIETLASGIAVAYSTFIKVDESKKLILKKDGVDYAYVSIKKDETFKKMILSFDDIPPVLKDKGIYTINVPEGFVTDNMGKIHNPAFTLEYKVGYTPEPPAPVETETMKAAKALLQNTGVGYPAADSDARMALAELTADINTPDENLTAAMDEFYKEENIELPVTGKYYTVAGVNAVGKKLYMTYAAGAISLTEEAAKATAFEAYAEGRMTFKTSDGKFIYVAGVTSDESIKSLTLSKFAKDGVDVKDVFGYLSVSGEMKNAVGTSFNTSALVNYETGAIATDVTVTTLYFAESLSSAFVMAEAGKPSDGEAVNVNCTITPDEIETAGNFTLTFSGVDKVMLADAELAYIADANGERIMAADVIAVPENELAFIIRVGNLSAGKCMIVLPEGTFKCVENGTEKVVKAINKEFTVTAKPVVEDFTYVGFSYSVYGVPSSADIPTKDVDLNNFNLYIHNGMYYSGLVANNAKTVSLKLMDTGEVIRMGHMEESVVPIDGTTAIKVVLDTPISEGELRVGKYTYVIEPAAFGDANYGKYLSGDKSINAKDCIVNEEEHKTVYVNNALATGIDEVSCSDEPVNVIYDLMGRRVDSMSKPGIYIVNGRKVVKK